MSENPIIENIRKLLRMRNGGTPDEIATALRLAQEMAAKHGIDLDSVNPNDDTRPLRPVSAHDAFKGARIQMECKYAGQICDEFFNVSVFTQRSWVEGVKLKFVGTDLEVEVALHIYRFLVAHFRREWNTRTSRLRNRQAFMWGMYLGLRSKLQERQPKQEEEGIVLVGRDLARRQDFISREFGEMTSVSLKPDHNASAALTAGWSAGRKTEIRPVVKDGNQEPVRLLG